MTDLKVEVKERKESLKYVSKGQVFKLSNKYFVLAPVGIERYCLIAIDGTMRYGDPFHFDGNYTKIPLRVIAEHLATVSEKDLQISMVRKVKIIVEE